MTIRRLVTVAAIAVRHGLAHVLKRGRVPGPVRLRRLLEDVGGTFLKFGQVLSLQPDILPKVYCDALFDLLDRVPPFPFADVETVFVEEFGATVDQLFSDFDPVPIASASIGQVHTARLGDRAVAVKVRRPDIEKVFNADLRLMGLVAALIRRMRLRQWYWLVRSIGEFTDWTREELDYTYEARFMAALCDNAQSSPDEAVPGVVERLSTRRVLTADLLDGPTVLDYIRHLDRPDPALQQRLVETGFDAEVFARKIVENFVSDAFLNGLFHADLHPANLLILPQSVVGYVDFGITGSFSRYSRRNIVAMTLALIRADSEALLLHFLRISTTDPGSDIDAFRRGLRDLVADWSGDPVNGGSLKVSFTTIMVDMLRLSRRTRVWPSPDVVRYMRSVITADGLVGRFAPDLDVGGCLESVCQTYIDDEVRRNWLSVEALADLATSGLRLVDRLPRTAASILAQLDGGDSLTVATSTEELARPAAGRVRSVALPALAAATAAVAAIGGPPVAFGLNLFTAEVVVAVIAGTMVLLNLVRGN